MYEPDKHNRWFVYQENNDHWIISQQIVMKNPTIIYLPEQVAKDLVVKLNAGTVVF